MPLKAWTRPELNEKAIEDLLFQIADEEQRQRVADGLGYRIANHPKELWPGIKRWWGNAFDDLSPESFEVIKAVQREYQ
jgi:hypothetical protein